MKFAVIDFKKRMLARLLVFFLCYFRDRPRVVVKLSTSLQTNLKDSMLLKHMTVHMSPSAFHAKAPNTVSCTVADAPREHGALLSPCNPSAVRSLNRRWCSQLKICDLTARTALVPPVHLTAKGRCGDTARSCGVNTGLHSSL